MPLHLFFLHSQLVELVQMEVEDELWKYEASLKIEQISPNAF